VDVTKRRDIRGLGALAANVAWTRRSKTTDMIPTKSEEV